MPKFTFSLVLSLLLFSCPLFATISSKALSFSDISGWEQYDPRPQFDAISKAFPDSNAIQRINPRDPNSIKRFIETHYSPVLIHDSQKESFATGYHVISIPASTRRTAVHNTPIYADPSRRQLSRNHSHAAIKNGALSKQNLEIAWADPVDVFFIQIQGSGILLLDDNKRQSIQYAAHNGHHYRSISQYMIDQGYITESQRSAPTIKWFLRSNPQLTHSILTHNPSYVYFKKNPSGTIIGAAGTTLTAFHSAAVDTKHYPLGSLLWVDTQLPYGDSLTQTPPLPRSDIQSRPFQSLMVAQDRGGAIKGPQRIDIYCGDTKEAEYIAGYLKAPVRVLLLKQKQ